MTDIFQFTNFAIKRRKPLVTSIYKANEEGVYLNINASPLSGLYADAALTTPVAPVVGTNVAGFVIPGIINMPWSQATVARHPTLVSDAGKTSLFFDGVDDHMPTVDVPTRDFFVNKPAQGFVICAKWISNQRFFKWHNPLSTGSTAAFSFELTTTTAVMHTSPMYSSANYPASINYVDDNQYHVWVGQADYSTGRATIWRDGIKMYDVSNLPVGNTSTTSPTSVDFAYRTSSNRASFYMPAIGFWRTAMSDERILEISQTVMNHTGLAT